MARIRVGFALLALLSGLWFGCGGPSVRLLDPDRPFGPRPTHFGLSLPVPVSSMPWPADSLRTGQAERRIPIFLQLDRKGRVGAVSFATPADSASLTDYIRFLTSFKFEPGLRDGVAADMILRLELQTGSPSSEPVLSFPVGPNREIVRTETYWAAMTTLGIEPARLLAFPSFYYIPSSASTGNHYDYKLYRVELDSLGQVMVAEPTFATIPRFTDQIRSAVIWATYEPMRLNGRAVASTNYLAVALFSEADYPTSAWSADTTNGLPDKERLRVRLLPDTVGEMLPPIVKRDWSGPIVDSATWGLVPDLMSTRIQVDTTGVSVLRESSVDSWRVRRMLIGRALDRGFYPARDFSGSLLPWPGLAYTRYLDRSHVQIWFDWSPVTDPGPAPVETVTP